VLAFASLMAASMIIRVQGKNGGDVSGGFLIWLGFSALFGLFVLGFGVRCIRGTARILSSSVIASVGIGLFNLGSVIFKVAHGQFDHPSTGFVILTSFEGITGVLLLAAGVFALLGRSQYEQWRKTQNPDSIQRSRFTSQIVCVGDERLLKEGMANLIRGWVGVGGWLHLTNKRLVFRPHGFNLRKQENTRFNVNKNELSIPLSEIEEVSTGTFLGVIPTRLQVVTSLGVRTFVVQPRRTWLKAIEEARGFHS
jgi:hypothetical protein